MLSQLPMPTYSQRRVSVRRQEDTCNHNTHYCPMFAKPSGRELWLRLSSKVTFHVPRDRSSSFPPVALDWPSSVRTRPSLLQAQSCTDLSVFALQGSNSLLGARPAHVSRHRWPDQPYLISARAQCHNYDSTSRTWMGGMAYHPGRRQARPRFRISRVDISSLSYE